MITLNTKDCFDPEQTFLCGQCFRWEKLPDNTFFGIVGDSAAKISCPDPYTVCIESGNSDCGYWERYLGLTYDSAAAKSALSADKIMQTCIERGGGIRILRQEVWETVISFIISANNNIPRIKKIISKLCELYGNRIDFDGRTVYGFPTAERLAGLELSDLAEIRAGFRDKYILDAARRVAAGEINLDAVSELDDAAAKAELMKIKGVGSKVADCVLLFALGRYKTFPLDVWTKRVLAEVYGVDEKKPEGFIAEHFGDYAGIAQQYLYYYYAIIKENTAKSGAK